MHYQLALTRSGEVAEILRLQGVNPELDACVEAVIESWKFGPSDESSFFKLKFIWSA